MQRFLGLRFSRSSPNVWRIGKGPKAQSGAVRAAVCCQLCKTSFPFFFKIKIDLWNLWIWFNFLSFISLGLGFERVQYGLKHLSYFGERSARSEMWECLQHGPKDPWVFMTCAVHEKTALHNIWGMTHSTLCTFHWAKLWTSLTSEPLKVQRLRTARTWNSLLRVLLCEFFSFQWKEILPFSCFHACHARHAFKTLLPWAVSKVKHGAKETVEELMPNPECPQQTGWKLEKIRSTCQPFFSIFAFSGLKIFVLRNAKQPQKGQCLPERGTFESAIIPLSHRATS